MDRKKIIRETYSVCPLCLSKIKAEVIEKDDKVYMEKTCADNMIEVEALRNGSRMKPVRVPGQCRPIRLVKEYGLCMVESVRQLGVSTSAVAKIVKLQQDS